MVASMNKNGHRYRAAQQMSHAESWNKLAKHTSGGLKAHAEAHAAHATALASYHSQEAIKRGGMAPSKSDVKNAHTANAVSWGLSGAVTAHAAHHMLNASRSASNMAGRTANVMKNVTPLSQRVANAAGKVL